jgi:type II secretory pathway pseudopilin PulG
MNKNNNAFSIIEILVWIFIFSLWIASVYAIISSTLRINDFNKNYIIASNLAREQIEFVRNIRDSNYNILKPYNLKNPGWNSYTATDKFEYNKKYKIENNYLNTASFPIKVTDITTDFWEWEWELNWKMLYYRLCIDDKNRYTYDCTSLGNIKTKFYKYISIEKVKYNEVWTEKEVDNAFIVKSKVIWYIKWYHEFEVKSIIADWKRL